ncbi:peptide transporter family 1-like isoform X1 [Leptidea sinapis]|uniref:peptide transporter family 1-like isoform X1 n=2 Tax=Leptidea sinapis TaxID=189913 RepID=UPI0021C32F02|nr:peptide transporter family 1-like isoform X1 [Leptidea sinapis]
MGAKVEDRFPIIVIIIIIAEFCERFSYSAMRAFLTLYLRSKLGFSDESATETYHVFCTLIYVFPIIGGILADNWLGKFRTIVYMMFIYLAGNVLVAVAAIPHLNLPVKFSTILGLFMITIGTGGIKPCVSSLGGEQFKLPQQEKHLAMYFSILYFTLCVGSLIAKTVSPILRSEVQCFGDKDCYSLAFGAPGIVVMFSIVIFVSGKKRYILAKPEGNIVLTFVKCIFSALKNTIKKGRSKDVHWLDNAHSKFDKRFITDVKRTLSILVLFTVLPVFWALLDQMGSRWTLQATKMNGKLGFVTIKPDQLQVIAPISILIFIPLTQKYIYPFLEKHNILTNPLHKLSAGGILAGVAFIASALVEIYIKTTYPNLPQAGFVQLRIFNGNPCSMSIENENYQIMYTIPSLSHYTNKYLPVKGTENITISLGGSCFAPRDVIFHVEEKLANSFFVTGDEVVRFIDNVDKSKSGLPVVRFLISNNVINTKTTLYNDGRDEEELILNRGVSRQLEVFASTYSIRDNNSIIMENIMMDSGGVYIIVMNKEENITAKLIVLSEANSITMALLLPQFLIMSLAEVLFAVTGNEFAFKESPESMRAVMYAVWLLTEAMGNVIIIIITRIFVDFQQETQSFIYSGLMFSAILIFHYLSRGYQFSHDAESNRCRSDSRVAYHQVKAETVQ